MTPQPLISAPTLLKGHAAARAAMACPTCGREPATRGEALQQREDLAIIWLHLIES